ncbi:MAG TPA: thiol:disulfide interchange protein DsbA/DsbL [Steroidobacteraceae bacterium]
MRGFLAILSATLLLTAGNGATAMDWVEGTHYFRIEPALPTHVAPGKIEVLEVFSYACPACNEFYPTADKLKAGLPANAQMVFLPAGFRPDEDWDVFQRAYITAQALGVADQAHDAVFDAVWKSGELAVLDPATHGLREHMPDIHALAKFYSRFPGVTVAKFVATAASMPVEYQMDLANEEIAAGKVGGTPTIIVNGRYRLDVRSAGGQGALIDLVQFLIAKGP